VDVQEQSSRGTASEFVACPDDGRRVTATRRVRLGDVTPTGRLRLDALARYLQDIAADDVDEAGIPGAWVLRRVELRVGRLPQFREDVELVTFCSGTGGRWAERRTTMSRASDGDVSVESVALWVYVDAQGRPAPLEDWFFDLYGAAANGRRVGQRLKLPAPPAGTTSRPWTVRRTDLDVLGHVNNAVAWAVVEDELARDPSPLGGRIVAAELEYRAAIDEGDRCEIVRHDLDGGFACWITVDGDVRVSARVLGEAATGAGGPSPVGLTATA
jgi:acyl-ACP thioesterase